MSSPPPLLRSVVEDNLEVAVPIGLRRRAKDRPAPPRVASRRRANPAGPPGTIFIFILTHFQNKVDVKNDKKVARIVYRESTKLKYVDFKKAPNVISKSTVIRAG